MKTISRHQTPCDLPIDEICTTPTALASSGERQPENKKWVI
jgi:hypothetical protein